MLHLKNFYKSTTNDNVMWFNNDDDFYEFCINPKLIILTRTDDEGNNHVYTDFNFTQQYLDAINNDKIFIIRDENSVITKRGEVSYRTISKPVQNLKNYYRTLDKLFNYGN